MEFLKQKKSYVRNWTLVFPNITSWMACSKDSKVTNLLVSVPNAEATSQNKCIWKVMTKERYWYSGIQPFIKAYNAEAFPTKHFGVPFTVDALTQTEELTVEEFAKKTSDTIITKLSGEEYENELRIVSRERKCKKTAKTYKELRH